MMTKIYPQKELITTALCFGICNFFRLAREKFGKLDTN